MDAPPLNHRLTATDAAFLYSEAPPRPMHIGAVLEYDARISRDELIDVLRGRMHLLPRYRQRVIFPPFGIGHPTWEDDPDFDVANHVMEMELPTPGDDRVLGEAGGREFARMLPRDRPLWKLVLLQGRPRGNSAVLAMVHHAMVDGISGVELTMVMHDLTPDAAPPAPPATPWRPRPLPDVLMQLQDAVRDQFVDGARRWADAMTAWMSPAEPAFARAASPAPANVPAASPAPPMPFNRFLSPERRFAWVELSLAEIRFIKSVLGGTVNDVVLAVLSGALGRYLASHGVPTTRLELQAMCPVSMRPPENQQSLGNLVSMMVVPLHAGIGDPVERLAAERAATQRLKAQDQAGALYALAQLGAALPPAVMATAAALGAPWPSGAINTVCTNVPGPQIPLYLAGRTLTGWYPLGPLASGIGLFSAVLTYNGKLTMGATVDPALVPDAWFFMDCLQAAFDELLGAAVVAAPVADKPQHDAEVVTKPAREAVAV